MSPLEAAWKAGGYCPPRAADWLLFAWRDLDVAQSEELLNSYLERLSVPGTTRGARRTAVERWSRHHDLSDPIRHFSAVESLRVPYGPTSARLLVLARDGFRCAYCGSAYGRTVDHVVPLAKGGARGSVMNLVASCHKCNSRKADKTPEEVGMRLLWEPSIVNIPRVF